MLRYVGTKISANMRIVTNSLLNNPRKVNYYEGEFCVDVIRKLINFLRFFIATPVLL